MWSPQFWQDGSASYRRVHRILRGTGHLRRLAGVDQLGGLIVFVVVAALLLGAFTGYLVWYGRWVGRRRWKRATRDSDRRP